MTTNGTAGAGTTRDFTGPHGWLFELSPNGWVTIAYPGGAKLTLEKHDLLAAAAWLAAPVAVAAESGAQATFDGVDFVRQHKGQPDYWYAREGYAEGYARGVAAGRDDAQGHLASLRRFLNERAGEDPDKPMLLPCGRATTIIKSLDEMMVDTEAEQERLVERVVARVAPAAATGLATLPTPEQVGERCAARYFASESSATLAESFAEAIRADRARRAQPPAAATAPKGLYGKFRVTRADGRDGMGEKHEGCQYFVLDLTHDKFAGAAIAAYAGACERESPVLAKDLRDKSESPVFAAAAGGEAAAVPVSVAERMDRLGNLYNGNYATHMHGRRAIKEAAIAELNAAVDEARREAGDAACEATWKAARGQTRDVHSWWINKLRDLLKEGEDRSSP